MKLYGMRMWGNCRKAAQILALTDVGLDTIEIDSNAGETRPPAAAGRLLESQGKDSRP